MDKEIFEITSITDHEENPKLEGRYPLRIGRTCKKPEAKCGYRAVIEYLKNSDGSDYSNRCLLTSTVKEIFTIENTKKTIIIIETQNSRYKFLKVENNTED